MNILFFIVLPLVTILISIVLQKLLRSPILVAILVFAVYLILAFTVFTTEFLINAIVYTILAFVTAVVVRIICCLIGRINCEDNNGICSTCNNPNTIQEDMLRLKDSINGLENNIDNLINLLASIVNNNNTCGCNRKISR